MFQVNVDLVTSQNEQMKELTSAREDRDQLQTELARQVGLQAGLELVMKKLKRERTDLHDKLLVIENDKVKVMYHL